MDLQKLKQEDFEVAKVLKKIFGTKNSLHPHQLIGKNCVIRVPEKNPKTILNEGDYVSNNHYVKAVGVSSHCYHIKEGGEVIIEVIVHFSLGIVGVFSSIPGDKENLLSFFKKLPKSDMTDSGESSTAKVELL